MTSSLNERFVRALIKHLPAKRGVLDRLQKVLGPDLHVALFYRFLSPVIEATTGSRNLHGGFFERGTESWHEAQERLTTVLGERCGFGPEHHLLEVGCGVGGAAATMARTLGCRVTGLNISRTQLRRAVAWMPRQGLENRVLFARGNATRMPFRWAQFDHAYAIEALSHIPDKEAVVREVARVTYPGARFGVFDACAEDPDALQADPDFGFVCSSWGVRKDAWIRPAVLPAAFQRHGFSLVEEQYMTPQVGPSAAAQAEYLRQNGSRIRDLYGVEVFDIIMATLEITRRYVASGLISYKLWIGEKSS